MRIRREKPLVIANGHSTIIKEEYTHHSFFYLNFQISKSDDVYSSLNKLSEYLRDHNLKILIAFGFGFNLTFNNNTLQATIPSILFYHIPSESCKVQLICTDSDHVRLSNYPGGATVRSLDHYGVNLYFINNVTTNEKGDHYRQAYFSFATLKSILENNDISYLDLARTWLYIDDILEWYDELNRARTGFYNNENISNGVIPASTGVGQSNINGKSLLISAYALVAAEDNCMIRVVESPMQCPATDYKSSFSRALEISFTSSKRLIISGTASLDSKGETLHKGNIVRQIEYTMEVLKSIMISNQYGWDNVVRAIAYFLYPEDEKHFTDYCIANNIDCSCVLTVGATICRDDLLFEIELDAVKPLKN